MKSRFLVAILAVGVLGFLASQVLSPFLALRGLTAAIERKDPKALERYVDFPRVREGLTRDLNARLVREMQGAQDPFTALGMLLAAGMVQALAEAFLTPEGLASLGTGKEPGQASLEEVRRWRLRFVDWSHVLVHHQDDPASGLLMERQGLGWRVVKIQLPLD